MGFRDSWTICENKDNEVLTSNRNSGVSMVQPVKLAMSLAK